MSRDGRSAYFASPELPTPDPYADPETAREAGSDEMSRESARLAGVRAYARAVAAAAPPFTPAQRAELHAIFTAAQQRKQRSEDV